MSNISPANSSPQYLGQFKDTGDKLFYGTGTKGPNASDPGSPYENLGMTAANGDSLTFTATKSPAGEHNSVAFGRHGADNELISRDLSSGSITALDNNKKYTTDKAGDIFSGDQNGGPTTKIGNFSDKNVMNELTQDGMSKQAADDFRKVDQTGAIQSLTSVHHDFSNSDRGLFNGIASQTLYDQQNDSTGGGSGSGGQYLSQAIDQILGVQPGASSSTQPG